MSKEAVVSRPRFGLRDPIRGLALAAVAALVLSGCGGAVPGSTSDEVSPLVVGSVTPVSNADLQSIGSMERKIAELNSGAVGECLKKNGHPDLLQKYIDSRVPTRIAGFEDPTQLLASGFGSQITLTEDEDTAITACQEAPQEKSQQSSDGSKAEVLYRNNAGVWFTQVVYPTYDSTSLDTAKTDFAQCLVRAGVPESTLRSKNDSGKVDVEGNFAGFLNSQQQAGVDTKKWAKPYVECGQPLWDAREKLLKPKRDPYLRDHHDELVELSDLTK